MASAGDTHDHAYLEIEPTADSLPAGRIADQFTQLHGTTTAPVEFLLVARPTDDRLRYYVGAPPDVLAAIDPLLNGLFPEYTVTKADTPPLTTPPEDCAVAELQGRGDRHDDWQTRLRPPNLSDAPAQHDTARVTTAPELALTSLADRMLEADATVVYQALLRPKPAWGADADIRIMDLEQGVDTYGGALVDGIVGDLEAAEQDDRATTTPAHEQGDRRAVPGSRIDGILAKSTSHSFDVNARILATGDDAAATAEQLASSFASVGGDFYEITHDLHTSEDATTLAEAITDATVREEGHLRRVARTKLPWASNRMPSIVADATTVAHFCLLDASALGDRTRRAMNASAADATSPTLPPEQTLRNYDGPGLALGTPLSQDGEPLDRTVAVPPAVQPIHAAIFGQTGSGKSMTLTNAITQNHMATDGADIVIEPKGDGMPADLLRAHYAEHGDLENVYYFDCEQALPAISFFDIRPHLEAGIHRESAVQRKVDHYIEILRSSMRGDFDQAVRSPDIIEYLLKAMFDPVHGADAFTHLDFYRTVTQFAATRDPPAVSDPQLDAMLAGIGANTAESFTDLLKGVRTRVEKVPKNTHLSRLLNHVHQAGAPRFGIEAVLDEDALVILDLGGLRAESQRVVTLVLLSELWSALKRRKSTTDGDLPLVNCYIEEAASIANSDLLSDLFRESRAFGISITLAMQYPAQLEAADADTYAELMNNVGTILAGSVPVDDRLTTRFATYEMDAEAVGNHLRQLDRGEWLVTLPGEFGEENPTPFRLESLSLPPGHPDGPAPLSEHETTAFDATRTAVAADTAQQHGLEPTRDRTGTPSTDLDRLDSTLPVTERLPDGLSYDADRDCIRCDDCGSRYADSHDGMLDAIGCCRDPHEVDPDDVPICDLQVTLSEEERADSGLTDRQLLFLQLVYDAQVGRFDPDWEFDIVRDSMRLLEDYAGIGDDAIEELIAADLLRYEGDNRPHRLYSVTPDGRDVIQEDHREGVAHGAGIGDMAESSQHALMVELATRYLDRTAVEDPDSPATRVVPYHEPDDSDRRLDAAALDADGEVVVAVEAERATNDLATAAPDDYDLMADCDPDRALWVFPNRATGSQVLDALHDPRNGAPRIEKTYSEETAPQKWVIDAPGLTEGTTIGSLRNALPEPPHPAATETAPADD
jgi:DNA helicase HerA-like ATPase